MYCGGKPEPKALQVLIMEYKYISTIQPQNSILYQYHTIFKMLYTHQYLFAHYGKAYTKLVVRL